MKALSLWQPWASLIAHGHKKLETRSWSTSYRGLLAIHATATWHSGVPELCLREPMFRLALSKHYPTLGSLPLGCIIATCFLIRCVRAEDIRLSLSDKELVFGDYSDGRWAWELGDVRLVDPPVACKGQRSIWSVPSHVEIANV